MRVSFLLVLLVPIILAGCSVAKADPGHIELSGVQRAFLGEPYAGAVYSIRFGCAKLPAPIPPLSSSNKVDGFLDGGATFAETSEVRFVKGLVGASVGFRGDTFRIGAGCTLPNPALSVYLRARIAAW